MKNFKINKNFLGKNYPVYFIADIAANHDGDLDRAKKLIEIAKENGYAHVINYSLDDISKEVMKITNNNGVVDLEIFSENEKIFGSIHGYHGTIAKKACEDEGGYFIIIV